MQTTLQERRRGELLVQIERTVERREKMIATIMRMTNKIAAMARQVRRYENIIPKAPPPPVPVEQRRPAKVLMKKQRRVRI